jgi:hypothetical protein
MDVQLFRHKSSCHDIKQRIQAEEKGRTAEKEDPILLWWPEQFDPFCFQSLVAEMNAGLMGTIP